MITLRDLAVFDHARRMASGQRDPASFTSTVDRAGEANTPYSRFPVLRVRTTMERTVPLNPFANTSFRQFQYVTECFGTIAVIRSVDKETSTEFMTAKEVRRLSL